MRWQLNPLIGLALVLAIPGPTVTAQAMHSAVAGRIVDLSTGHPVPDADVIHLKDGRVIISDSLGRYYVDSLPAGLIRLLVRGKGFPPLMLTVALAEGEKMSREIELDSTAVGRTAAQQLPRVAVEALRAPIPRFSDFERRRSTGRGQYLTREDLEKTNVASLQDAMRGLRGVHVTCGYGTNCTIRMARAPMRCAPDYIVDERLDNWFGPSTPIRDIEGIEVYTGPADVPGEFAGSTAGCGVIVIWTRAGPSRHKSRR
jgi:hypothetical protein